GRVIERMRLLRPIRWTRRAIMPENPAPNPAWKNQGTGPPKKESPSVPAWKKEPGAAAGAPSGGGPRGWQSQPATPAAPPQPMSRTTKLVFATGLLGLLVGAIVVVMLLLKPARPACLVVLGASYDVNLAVPHNAYGWQGL